MTEKLRIDHSNFAPEVREAMINAAAKVYAAGLIASNSTSDDIRRRVAREDVDDFFQKLAEMGQ